MDLLEYYVAINSTILKAVCILCITWVIVEVIKYKKEKIWLIKKQK